MKKTRRIYQKLNMFFTLLLSTILPCVLATLLLALVLLPMMRSIARTTDDAYAEVIFSSAEARMAAILDMIKDQENRLLNAEWLKDLYFDHLMGKTVSFERKEDVLSTLGPMVAANSELYSVSFVLYESPNTMYSSSGVFEDITFLQETAPETFYYHFYALESREAGFETIAFKGKTYLLYHTPFSAIPNGQPKGVLNILLRHETVGKALAEASENHGQRFSLLQDDREVWVYGDEPEDAVTLSRPLDDSGLTLTMSISSQVSTRTSGRVMPRVLLTLAVSLLISVALSYLLSRFTYRPIETVTQRFLNGRERSGNELLALQQVLEQLVSDKSTAEASLTHLRPMARQKLLSGLLDGTAFLEDNVDEQLHYCRVLLDRECCNVISVSVPFAQVAAESCTTEVAMETLAEHLSCQLPLYAYVFSKDADNFKILVNYDNWEHLQSFLSQLMANCKDYFGKRGLEHMVFLGVGQAVQSPEDLYRCAEQADTAINVAILNQLAQPMFYSEVSPELNYEYFYPFADELLLSRSISNCNIASAKAQLNTIIEENKRNSKLAPKCLSLLYMDIYSTISRSGRSLGITVPRVETIEKMTTLDTIQEKLERLIDEICQQIAARRDKTILDGEKEILAYIEKHLFDVDLSLNSIADTFGMSNAYISTLIKNHYETNYCTYVNQARIQKAMQLMSEEGLDISAVYSRVGYANSVTFRRNLKKYGKGVSEPEELA